MDTWISDTSDSTDLNKINYLFHTFQSLGSWPIGSRVITGFLQLLGSLGSLVFYLFLVSVSFTVTMWLRECEVQENGIAHKYKWQKSETYIRNQTYKQLVWMATPINYSMAWSVESPRFICLCINFSHYLNQRISDPFFQTK